MTNGGEVGLKEERDASGAVETVRQPLLPVRHPTQDLFICDILDAVPKDDMASSISFSP